MLLDAAKAVGRFVWEYLIPHIETEDVALNYVGDDKDGWSAYGIMCSLRDVEPGETFIAIAEVDSITWLGIGITYRIGNFRPWPAEACRG